MKHVWFVVHEIDYMGSGTPTCKCHDMLGLDLSRSPSWMTFPYSRCDYPANEHQGETLHCTDCGKNWKSTYTDFGHDRQGSEPSGEWGWRQVK